MYKSVQRAHSSVAIESMRGRNEDHDSQPLRTSGEGERQSQGVEIKM
jgi:hypothetical protein